MAKSSAPPRDQRIKVTPANRTKILTAARAGDSLATIAAWAGVTRERVRQIIAEEDPSFVSPRAPHLRPRRPAAEPRPCAGQCFVCGKDLCPPRSVYCSDKHAEVGRLWRTVTSYRAGHHEALARYVLRNSDDKVQRRWARRVLKGEAGNKRWLLEGSQTYEILRRYGLLDKLPEEIKIL